MDLNDKDQVEQFRKDVVERLGKIDKSGLPGKLKLCCLQFGLFPMLMWPFSLYQLPRCLGSVALYGKGILQLSISSLTEEFKRIKVRAELLA